MLTSRRTARFLPFVLVIALAGCGASGGDDASDPTAKGTTSTAASDPVETTTAQEPAETTTTEEPTETTVGEEPAGDEDICVPLKVLSEYDQKSADIVEGDWASVQAFFVESTPAVIEAYDEAIALDSEVTDELEELRGVTENTAELAAEATDINDLAAKLLATPGLEEAGQAGLTLNTFAEETCGFSTSGAANG